MGYSLSMESMYVRRLGLLAAIVAFLLAVLCCTVFWRSYGYAIVMPDTMPYWYLRHAFVVHADPLWESARAPGFGFVLGLALMCAQPGLAIFSLHSLLFCLNISVVCVAGTRLWKNPWVGLLLACVLLAVEVYLMQTLFYSILLLSDSLYANLLFGGTVLFALGILERSRITLLIACLLLGLTNSIRPMGTALVLYLPLLIILRWRAVLSTRTVLAGIGLLLLPILLWITSLSIAYGGYRENPFLGLHLVSHTSALVAEQDQVFADPGINAAFHETLKAKLPEFSKGAYDPFGNTRGTVWWTMLSFYGSLTEVFRAHEGHFTPQQGNDYGFQIAVLSKKVAMRTIFLHPWHYAANVLNAYQKLFNPSQFAPYQITIFQAEPSDRFMHFQHRSIPIEQANQMFYHTDLFPDFTAMHFGFSRFLSHFVIDNKGRSFFAALGSLPAVFYSLLLLVSLLLVTLSRSKPAALVTLLILVAVVQYGLTALITLVLQARFSVAGAMGLHLAAIIGLFAAITNIVSWFRQTRRSSSIRRPARDFSANDRP